MSEQKEIKGITCFDPILPSNRKLLDDMTTAYNSAKAEVGSDAEWKEAAINEMKRAHHSQIGSNDVAAWNDFRPERVNRIIIEKDVSMAFFQQGELGEGDFPIIINDNPEYQPFSYISVAQNGATYEAEVKAGVESEIIKPITIASETIGYHERDVDHGRLERVGDRVNNQLAESWRIKADEIRWNLIKSAMGEFPDNTVAIMDHRIKNYPTTNIIDATNSTYPVGFNKEAVKALLAYCIEAQIRLINLFVSIGAMIQTWDWAYDAAGISGVTKPIPDSIREQIWAQGVINQMFGYVFNIQPLQILDDGECWASTDKPLGFWWDRGQDRVYTEDTRMRNRKLWVQIEKEVAYAIPAPMRPNAIKLLYRTS